MNPLVSILIPSRKRVSKLWQTVIQLEATATGEDYEILFRFDDDDVESVSAIPQIENSSKRTCFVGSRLDGYRSLDKDFYRELEEKANGRFMWIAGDDMIVSGDWLGELRKVPEYSYIIQPEISRLGGSVYHRAEAQAFPIYPRFAWKKYAAEFPRPFDTNGHELFRRHGWKTWFLPGVTMWHDRPSEEEIKEHRK